MLGQLESADRVLIADLEAGVGNLTRMAAGSLDLLLIVAEATPKSIEVAQRAASVAAERHVAPVRFIANKVRTDADRELLRDALGGDAFEIGEDDAVTAADRAGVAVLDRDPSAAIVRQVARLADTIMGTTEVPA